MPWLTKKIQRRSEWVKVFSIQMPKNKTWETVNREQRLIEQWQARTRENSKKELRVERQIHNRLSENRLMKENNENKITRENWGGRTENENKREVKKEARWVAWESLEDHRGRAVVTRWERTQVRHDSCELWKCFLQVETLLFPQNHPHKLLL